VWYWAIVLRIRSANSEYVGHISLHHGSTYQSAQDDDDTLNPTDCAPRFWTTSPLQFQFRSPVHPGILSSGPVQVSQIRRAAPRGIVKPRRPGKRELPSQAARRRLVLPRSCEFAARRRAMHPACTPPWGNRTGKLRGIQERRLRSGASRSATFERVGFPSRSYLPAVRDSLHGGLERLVPLGRSYQQYVTTSIA
jgi:hypothetical protein